MRRQGLTCTWAARKGRLRCAELEQQLGGRKQMERRQDALPSYQGDWIPLGRCMSVAPRNKVTLTVMPNWLHVSMWPLGCIGRDLMDLIQLNEIGMLQGGG